MPATLWAPEVVGNDDVAWLQSRHQDLFDVSAEALAIDCAVEDPRCGQPCDPQRGEKRAGLPAPRRGRLTHEAISSPDCAVKRGQGRGR